MTLPVPAPADDDVTDVTRERIAFDVAAPGFNLLHAVALLPLVDGRAADVETVEDAVTAWASLVAERVERAGALVALHDVLFATMGLRGDESAYDAPRNSFLDDVVRRRRGLPIALSVLCTEIAQRAGVHAFGLALPGHFMCAVVVDEDESTGTIAVVDPFRGGRIVPPDELAKRLGVPTKELGEVLQPARPEQVLQRMLTNLRGSYARRQDHVALARVLSRLLVLKPRDATLLLERAEARRMTLDGHGAVDDARLAMTLARDENTQRAGTRILELVQTPMAH